MSRYSDFDREQLKLLKSAMNQAGEAYDIVLKKQEGRGVCKNCGIDFIDLTAPLGLAIFNIKQKYIKVKLIKRNK